MYRIKRFINLGCIFILLVFLCGCTASYVHSDKVKIICTAYPQFDWVKNIVGESDNVDVELLIKNGADLHNYQPSARDIVEISKCDILIYIGGESDSWINELMSSINSETDVINMLSVLENNLLSESVDNESHDKEHDHDHAFDEHVWLSLSNAKKVCRYLTDVLINNFIDNAEIFEKNLQEYLLKIENLENLYIDSLSAKQNKTVVFADRFPFKYLFEDLDINYYAAFPGCSAETEASFETVLTLSKAIDNFGLKNVFVTENSNRDIAQSVIDNSSSDNLTVMSLNSMQSVTEEDIDNGISYLNIMESNLNTLINALN